MDSRRERFKTGTLQDRNSSLMDRIFGNVELVHKDGRAARELPSTAKVVGIFFASSNAETAEFASRLKATCSKLLGAGKLLYIVYVSLDTDNDDAVCTAMPDLFVALPQSAKSVRDKLWLDLQLQASPSLVLYDGVTGHIITKNGKRVILDDPEGTTYPWVPQTLDALLGDVLIQNNGREACRRDVLEGKFVGLFFAAQWSAPSLKMLEKLYVTFQKIKARRTGPSLVCHKLHF